MLNDMNYGNNAFSKVPPIRSLVMSELYKRRPDVKRELNQQAFKYTGMSTTQLRYISTKQNMHIYMQKKMISGNPLFSLIMRPKDYPMDRQKNVWKYNNISEKFVPHFNK